MPEIPAGRRPIERGEHLFVGRRKKCRVHLWASMGGAHGDPVVCCTVCGRLKRGETMPVGWKALVP